MSGCPVQHLFNAHGDNSYSQAFLTDPAEGKSLFKFQPLYPELVCQGDIQG